MQEDAAYAQSLQLIADNDNSKKTRANTLANRQQMSSISTRENLQMMLDIVTPLEDLPDDQMIMTKAVSKVVHETLVGKLFGWDS